MRLLYFGTVGSLKAYSYDSLIRNFSFVFQRTYLFSNTTANNIRFGKLDASMDEATADVDPENKEAIGELTHDRIIVSRCIAGSLANASLTDTETVTISSIEGAGAGRSEPISSIGTIRFRIRKKSIHLLCAIAKSQVSNFSHG